VLKDFLYFSYAFLFWSSCFYQLYNHIVALFTTSIRNTPESIIFGSIATGGCIKYQFSVFGGVSVLVIEMKVMSDMMPLDKLLLNAVVCALNSVH
jgi:hypothetical protein